MSEQNGTKDALKVLALKQRIGELTSNYEDQLADLRAEATMTIQSLSNRLDEIQNAKDGDTGEDSGPKS